MLSKFNKALIISTALVLLNSALTSSLGSAQNRTSNPTWDVYPARPNGIVPLVGRLGGPVRHGSSFGGFSPRGGVTFTIRQALDNAKSSVPVQAYSLASVPMAKVLLRTHGRGVKVLALLHKSQKAEKESSADFLVNASISTKVERSPIYSLQDC